LDAAAHHPDGAGGVADTLICFFPGNPSRTADRNCKTFKSVLALSRNFAERFQVAGGLGFEPRLTESESSTKR
jgi:hypothetical protein